MRLVITLKSWQTPNNIIRINNISGCILCENKEDKNKKKGASPFPHIMKDTKDFFMMMDDDVRRVSRLPK